jgi:hypothetical protein
MKLREIFRLDLRITLLVCGSAALESVGLLANSGEVVVQEVKVARDSILHHSLLGFAVLRRIIGILPLVVPS